MITIGPYTLNSPLVVAPMAGISDLPFRKLCLKHGAGMAVSEMIAGDPGLWNSRKSSLRVPHDSEAGICSIQIVGNDPNQIAEAAQAAVLMGAQIVDINMGCPVRKVCRKAAGSALLKDEPLVARILEKVVQAVEIPVTLKIRTGWDPETRNAVSVARIAEQSGIAALAVHGRTRADFYRGEAEYVTIAAVREVVSIPLFANGDIDSPQKAKTVLEVTGADGLLIGRAARGNPWIFREIRHFLSTGQYSSGPGLLEVQQTLLEHLEAIHSHYGEMSGVRIARKHIGWYLEKIPESSALRRYFNKLQEAESQRNCLEQFFAGQNNLNELSAA